MNGNEEKESLAVDQPLSDAPVQDRQGDGEQPKAEAGRQCRSGSDEELDADLDPRCRRNCKRHFWTELLRTIAKVAGVVLAAMGLSSFGQED